MVQNAQILAEPAVLAVDSRALGTVAGRTTVAGRAGRAAVPSVAAVAAVGALAAAAVATAAAVPARTAGAVEIEEPADW